MNTYLSKTQTSNQTLLELKTLVCPKCGWHGNNYNVKRLSIIKCKAVGIMNEQGFIIPQFKNWNYGYCPKCLCTNLLLINQDIYAKKTASTSRITQDSKEWLKRQVKC